MKEQWRKLAARFDALLMRERILVLVGAVVGTALLYDTLALQPLDARKKRLERQIAETRNSIKLADVAAGPDGVKRSYRDVLRQQLTKIDQSMQGVQRGLVPPERMAKLLEEILSRSRGLQLVSLRTLPVKRFETPTAAPAGKAAGKAVRPAPRNPERIVYQHSFEITLQGSYVELHGFLAQLEKLPWQMFWGRISVNIEQHPQLRVIMTVQTLSLSKAWLIV
jgi:MSHA biogenesis protein MshJ